MIDVPKRQTYYKQHTPCDVWNLPDHEDTKETGTMLVIETGSYSSRGVFTVLRVVKRLDPVSVAREYYAALTSIEKESKDGFVLFLVTAGYCEDVTHDVWNIGDYRLFD